MQLKPFKEIISYSKDKLREVMAAPRAKRFRAQAEMEMAEIETEILRLEGEIEESIVDYENTKTFDFKGMIAKVNKVALLELNKKRYTQVITQLFPDEQTEEPK